MNFHKFYCQNDDGSGKLAGPLPEFYAAYRLMNLKDHQIFNDKFQLNVLELNEIHFATEENRKCGLDKWAALFKAGTWSIRRESEAREEFYFEQRRQQKRLEKLEKDNSAKDETISSQAAEIARLREKLSALGLDGE